MKREKRIRLKQLLTAKGYYDSTPDTNIERLEKQMVDLTIQHTKKPELVKELDKKKREAKEKPIRTSLLLWQKNAKC